MLLLETCISSYCGSGLIEVCPAFFFFCLTTKIIIITDKLMHTDPPHIIPPMMNVVSISVAAVAVVMVAVIIKVDTIVCK